MIVGDAETFIVQRQADGRLLVQRIEITNLRVSYSAELHSGGGLYTRRPTLELVGYLDGGGYFDSEDVALFAPAKALEA